MRWLFILLLAVNVAYAGWWLNEAIFVAPPTHNAPAAQPLPADTPKLTLLAELEGQPERRDAPAADMANASAPAATGAVSDEAASPEAPPAEAAADRSESVAGTDAAAAPVPQCLTIGPFESRGELSKTSAQLAKLASQTRSRSDTTRDRRLFQVFLEPSGSESEAEQRLAELKSKGIEDYLLIRRGEMRNAISVGVFRSQESVSKRLSELEGQGYKAIVVPKYQERQSYWIDLVVDSARASPEAIAAQIPKDVKAAALPCDKIARADAAL